MTTTTTTTTHATTSPRYLVDKCLHKPEWRDLSDKQLQKELAGQVTTGFLLIGHRNESGWNKVGRTTTERERRRPNHQTFDQIVKTFTTTVLHSTHGLARLGSEC